MKNAKKSLARRRLAVSKQDLSVAAFGDDEIEEIDKKNHNFLLADGRASAHGASFFLRFKNKIKHYQSLKFEKL